MEDEDLDESNGGLGGLGFIAVVILIIFFVLVFWGISEGQS